MGHPELVVASNRGPLSFTTDSGGGLVARRGAGGLVTSLGPAVAGTGAAWVAAAITELDRRAASLGIVEAEGFRLRSLELDPGDYRRFYDTIANGTLWFLNHGLFDLPRRPRIDRRWYEAWAAFRRVNRSFAEVVAEETPEGGTVLVHDYHLALVGSTLATLRPDLRTAYFHHTPFCDPAALAVLPDEMAAELLGGMAASGACGFHSARWARAFEACCQAVLGSVPATFVAPAAIDTGALEAVAASPACEAARARLEEEVGDRAVIVRVDRIEPSKNILRGFLAFEALLEEHPSWRERVVFKACVYPSRDSLPDYMAYRGEVEALVERINAAWSTPGWTPLLLDNDDAFPRSVAALRRADVTLVNPVRDGLNLVALEGPAVNERDGVLVLSRQAGAWDLLAGAALGINPFDVAGTAAALHQALTMAATERADRAVLLRDASRGRTPEDWLGVQLREASPFSGHVTSHSEVS